jgi:hypothetical protein
MDSFDREGVAQHRKVGAGPLSKRSATSFKVLINPPIKSAGGVALRGCSPFNFLTSSSGEAVIDAISVHRSGGLAQTTKSMIDLIDALNLPLPWSAWRKAESSLVMNFTIEFFRTRPSDEAHATLGSDFDRRRQSQRCNGESEVAFRHAGHATKTGNIGVTSRKITITTLCKVDAS